MWNHRSVVIAALAVAPFGCHGPAPSPVEGSVTFLGRPLPGGLVVFSPDAGRGGSGKCAIAVIASTGQYVLPSLTPGWYRISLADPPSWNAVIGCPAELRRPDRSGLSREIRPGRPHRFDFRIEAAVSR